MRLFYVMNCFWGGVKGCTLQGGERGVAHAKVKKKHSIKQSLSAASFTKAIGHFSGCSLQCNAKSFAMFYVPSWITKVHMICTKCHVASQCGNHTFCHNQKIVEVNVCGHESFFKETCNVVRFSLSVMWFLKLSIAQSLYAVFSQHIDTNLITNLLVIKRIQDLTISGG